jgi:hypothetical protein
MVLLIVRGVDAIDHGLQCSLLDTVFLHYFFLCGHLLLQWLQVLHLLIHGIEPSQDSVELVLGGSPESMLDYRLMLAEATPGTRDTMLSPVRGHTGLAQWHRTGKAAFKLMEMAKPVQECDAPSCCPTPTYKGTGRLPILSNSLTIWKLTKLIWK